MSSEVKCMILLILTVGVAVGDNGGAEGMLRASNSFGLEFHRRISTGMGDDNVVMSPLSLDILLAMAAYGARAQTRAELNRVLFGRDHVTEEELLDGYGTIVRESIQANEHVLSTANFMYPSKSFSVRDEFRDALQQNFSAAIEEVDFTDAATTGLINKAVSDATHGKIDKLFSELDDQTEMVLVNAVYFKGKWKTEFNAKDTKEVNFYQEDGTTENGKVQLMYVKSSVDYVYDAELRAAAIKLPYNDSNTAMIIILPDVGIAKQEHLSDKMSMSSWDSLFAQFHKREVKVYLPRFRIESTHDDLVSVIKGMGAQDLFGPRANFSGITDEAGLYASSVIQKAMIDVNEEGTEAAAASGMGFFANSVSIGLPPLDIEFRADRPFMFAVVSVISPVGNETQFEYVPLFSGKYVKP